MAAPPQTPPEQAAPAPPPPAAEPAPRTCPRCATPYDPTQEYCLQCGLRLPRDEGVIVALRENWTRRVPWYPGDWVWPTLLALVVAGVGAALAAAALLAIRLKTPTPAT